MNVSADWPSIGTLQLILGWLVPFVMGALSLPVYRMVVRLEREAALGAKIRRALPFVVLALAAAAIIAVWTIAILNERQP